MADNPVSRYATTAAASTEDNPFSRYRAAEPAGAAIKIDFSQSEDATRAQIAALPADKRPAAYKAWADAVVTQERSSQGVGGAVNNGLRAVARGLPGGTFLDEARGLVAQAGNYLGLTKNSYDEEVAFNRAADDQFDKANPKISMGLQLTGALATAPLAPALTVAKSGSLLANTANAVATGVAYGGLHGAGLGDGTEDRATKAATGAALGGAFGGASAPIAAGAANAYRYTKDAFRPLPAELSGVSRGASDRVTRAVNDDALTAQQYAQKSSDLGHEAMLADMGVNLGKQAQGIATQPGSGAATLRNAIEARGGGARARIDGDVSNVLGPSKNLVQLEKDVIAETRAKAAPLYDQFNSIVIKPSEELINSLQRVPQEAWARAQKLAAGKGYNLDQIANTGRGINLIKQAVDDLASKAGKELGRGSTEYSTWVELSAGIRHATDRILSPNAPGQSIWARARREAGEGFQFRDGLNEGRAAFSRGAHPDQMAADMATMSGIERQAFVEGGRGHIRDIMGNASTKFGENGAAAARSALGSDYARQKIALMAPEKGDQLIRRLDAETVFDRTRTQVYQGTETASRLAAQKEFPSAASRSEAAGEIGKKGLGGLATELGYRALNATLGGHLDARNASIAADAARMLSAQGPQRDAFFKGLSDYGQSKSVSQQQKQALEQVLQRLLSSTRQPMIAAK